MTPPGRVRWIYLVIAVAVVAGLWFAVRVITSEQENAARAAAAAEAPG